MKKLILGAAIPLTASLGLWLGLGGSVAAHSAPSTSHPATAVTRVVNDGPGQGGNGDGNGNGGGNKDTDNVQVQCPASGEGDCTGSQP